MKIANKVAGVIPSTARDLLFVFLLLSGLPASAQVATGTPPFGSFSGGPETINNANLNTHWTYPILHKTGRGLNFQYDAHYDSSVWFPTGAIGSQVWQPVGFDGGGWVWVESSRCGGSLAAPGRPSGRYKQGPWLLDDADNNGNFWIRSCYERSSTFPDGVRKPVSSDKPGCQL